MGGIAPSYYLEGLLYNVPNDKFTTSYQDCFINTMNWIQNEAEPASAGKVIWGASDVRFCNQSSARRFVMSFYLTDSGPSEAD